MAPRSECEGNSWQSVWRTKLRAGGFGVDCRNVVAADVMRRMSLMRNPPRYLGGYHNLEPTLTFTLGHSPDPDDAFMFYGLAKGLIPTPGFRFEHVLQDIQTLNERAMRGEL